MPAGPFREIPTTCKFMVDARIRWSDTFSPYFVHFQTVLDMVKVYQQAKK